MCVLLQSAAGKQHIQVKHPCMLFEVLHVVYEHIANCGCSPGLMANFVVRVSAEPNVLAMLHKACSACMPSCDAAAKAHICKLTSHAVKASFKSLQADEPQPTSHRVMCPRKVCSSSICSCDMFESDMPDVIEICSFMILVSSNQSLSP